jgi:N-sulfoglucosamine sulfohydrolase
MRIDKLLFWGIVIFANHGMVVDASENRPPNFVVITADDLGWQLGCYGDTQAKTPNIDQLASEGMLFRQGYVTQSSCSPSRASILTGLFPVEHGHWALASHSALKPSLPLLPNILKRAGYRTGILGKLHVTPAPGESIDFDFEWAKQQAMKTRDVGELARQAERFIQEAGDEPFFLYVNYFDPHRPYDREADQVNGLPEKVLQAGEVTPMSFIGLDEPPQLLAQVATYYNCVHRLDAGVGMLLEVLKRHQADQNTLLIFLGDNGPDFVRSKTSCYLAGVRVPFIVRWPGVVDRGRVSEALVSGVDIAPTLLAAASAVPEEGYRMSGVSLLPVLHETQASVRQVLPVEYTAHAGAAHFFPRRGLTDGKYLYIKNLLAGTRNPVVIQPWKMPPEDHPMHEPLQRFMQPPPIELFHIQDDPDGLVNLAEHPQYRIPMAKLGGELQSWREKVEDRFLSADEFDKVAEELSTSKNDLSR